jgi:PPM family protein phosphatase
MMNLHIGHWSDVGLQRENNEDSYLILTPPAVAGDIQSVIVVADGMGGHRAGDVASRLLVDSIAEQFSSSDYDSLVAYSPAHPDYYVVVLKEILESANQRLYQAASTSSELSGMGTTATMLLFANDHVFWGHVGDSRAYLIRDNQLQQITQDHTWVDEQIRAGVMTPKQAARHPRRQALTQSMGGSPLVKVDRGMLALRPDDQLLLCSDGLSGVVSNSELHAVLLSGRSPQVICQHLVTLANEHGGPDNVTVLLAKVTEEPVGPPLGIEDGTVVGPLAELPLDQDSELDTLILERRSGLARRRRRMLSYFFKVATLFAGCVISGGLMPLLLTMYEMHEVTFAIAGVALFVFGALVGGWLVGS